MRLALLLVLCVALAGCASQQDGTALYAACDAKTAEYTALADAFTTITQGSQMAPEAKAKVLARIGVSRVRFQKLDRAEKMLINALVSVDYTRLLLAAEGFALAAFQKDSP